MGKDKRYQNPVWPDAVPDPAVIAGEKGGFYCYGTPEAWDDGSCHQIPILYSEDLVGWEYRGSVFEQCPGWGGGECLWACEIAQIRKRYILYYTLIDGAGKPAIGCAAAETPEGPFTDKGCLLTPEEALGIWAIDPCPVQDEKGRWHLICGNYEQGTCIVLLSEDGTKKAGKAVVLAPGYEGVCILREKGYYYLLGSLGTCTQEEKTSYHVVCARSKSLFGPYTDRQGNTVTEETKDREDLLVTGRGKGARPRFIGPGNNTYVRDDNGDIWLVLHAVDMENMLMPDGGTRRVLCIEKLYWDEEGWPYTENREVSAVPRKAPYFHSAVK